MYQHFFFHFFPFSVFLVFLSDSFVYITNKTADATRKKPLKKFFPNDESKQTFFCLDGQVSPPILPFNWQRDCRKQQRYNQQLNLVASMIEGREKGSGLTRHRHRILLYGGMRYLVHHIIIQLLVGTRKFLLGFAIFILVRLFICRGYSLGSAVILVV